VARLNNSTRAERSRALIRDEGSAESLIESWEAECKLTQAAARGRPDAQRQLLQRALPVVRRTVRYLLRSSQDVDDAVQSSLLAVLDSAGRFAGRASLNTWVTRITTRTTLRYAQKQRTLVPADQLDVAVEPVSGHREEEFPRRVWEYLEKLPEPQRVAIVLRHGLDYGVQEIAEVTESSPNTVKYRLKEALEKIRRLVRLDLSLGGKGHED
jgi:RNA polymerase sigma-70 factor (ECF subfamily)